MELSLLKLNVYVLDISPPPVVLFEMASEWTGHVFSTAWKRVQKRIEKGTDLPGILDSLPGVCCK